MRKSPPFASVNMPFRTFKTISVGLILCFTFLGLEARDTHAQSGLKVGSVINLKNNYPGEGGYLDTRGRVADKAEFAIVPSETLFVSTHPNPNRDQGSGSWKIVSASGKGDGEALAYGDRIHLMNMYPGAGYLDNCGWIKDMPVYKGYAGAKFAVFTTQSPNRDNGSGTWIVRSAGSKADGSPVLAGDSIRLENGYPQGGFLDVNGRVTQNPAFKEYEGSTLLVFLSESPNRFKNSGSWTITDSNAGMR